MPIYDYLCPECGAERELFNRVSERRTNAPDCHGPMDIKLSANLGYVQRECRYECPVTGKVVTSHRERRNVMAEHDLVDANDFKPDMAHRKAKKRYDDNAAKAALLKTPLSDKVLDQYRPALPTSI